MCEKTSLEAINKYCSKCIHVLLIFSILSFLCTVQFINIYGFSRFCNSDVYADMQVAKRIWEQKTLFPEGWTFGNQYYVIATPVIAAIFYGLFGNINIAMMIATGVMTALILISFAWLLRSFTKEPIAILAGTLLLLMSNITPYGPYSINSMLFFQQSSFYACYLVTAFLVFGDYMRALNEKQTSKAGWLLSLGLCFATGMQSLRQTVVMILPILACELFQGGRRFLQNKRPWTKEYSTGLIHACSYGVANVCGVITIHLLDIPNASIYGEMQMVAPEQFEQKLIAVVNAVCELTGMDYILQDDFSRTLAIVFIFSILLVLVAAVLWLARITKQESGLELCWLLCVVSILGVFLATVVLNITLRSIYAFMWFPLIAFSGLMIIRKLPEIPQKCMVIFLCVLSIAGLYSSYSPYVEIILHGEKTDAQVMSRWAVDNGYEYVYGDYWGMAPQVAVSSNGELEAGCWHSPENVFMVELSNTPQDIYGIEENKKAIYVFTSVDEQYGLCEASKKGVQLLKVAEFGDINAYVSPIPLMRKW